MNNTNEQTVEPLEWARSVCHESVSHVGYANYRERESEAHGWVDEVFNKLPNTYKVAPDMYEALKEAYEHLPTTVPPEQFLAGQGNWGLTENEYKIAIILAKALTKA